jgi:hypothetical protein
MLRRVQLFRAEVLFWTKPAIYGIEWGTAANPERSELLGDFIPNPHVVMSFRRAKRLVN